MKTTQQEATSRAATLSKRAAVLNTAWNQGDLPAIKELLIDLATDLDYIKEEMKRQLFENLK